MNQNHYKNILIIKHGSLGDIISATSVIKSIKDRYTDSNIVILTATKYRGFIMQSKLASEILIDDRRGIFLSLKLLFSILSRKYDLIVDLQNSSRTLCYGLFYQINLLGCEPSDKPYVSWLKLSNLSLDKIENKKFFLISPGCSTKHVQKKWPEKNYIDVCKFLLTLNVIPVLIGTNEDKKIIELISNEDDKILNLCDKSPLDVVYTLAIKAEGALSNDSGPAHLIAASGCNIHIILSSFSNPKTVIPQSENVSFSQSNKIFQISSNDIIEKIKNFIK